MIWESLATTPQLLALCYCRMHATLLVNQARQRLESCQHEDLFLQFQQSLEEVEECQLKITRIADEVASNERLVAEGRIKKGLRYRLGNTLVCCSQTLGGWLRMPFALVGEIRRSVPRSIGIATDPSKAKRPGKKNKKVLAVKQQLSYRLGCKLVKHARSPIGWITLPFALVRETVAFRRKLRRQKSTSKTVTKTSHKNDWKQRK